MPILGIWASSTRQGQGPAITGSYDALATYTVPSGGVSSIEFAGIPTGGQYTHLQIRGIYRSNRSATLDPLMARFNSNASTSVYTQHAIYGNGSSVVATTNPGEAGILQYAGSTANSSSNVFGGFVMDILDYASTTKNKTLRSLGGYDNNGDGFIALNSGAYLSTSAIDTIRLYPFGGTMIEQNSQFALYGIRG